MTNDEIQQNFVDDFKELHANIEAMPDGPAKDRAEKLAVLFHKAGEALAKHLHEGGVVQPLDGTSKPKP